MAEENLDTTEEVVDEDVEVVEEQTTEAVAAEPEPLWKQFGLPESDFDGLSDDDVRSRLRSTYTRSRELEDRNQQLGGLAQLGNQYLQHQKEFSEYMQERQARTQRQQAAEGEPWWKGLWNPPAFDPKVLQDWVDPANPNQFKQDTPPDVRKAAVEYHRYMTQFRDQFEQNPAEYIYNVIENSPIINMVEARMQERIAQAERQREFQRWEADNADWIYLADEQGNFRRDQQGRLVMSGAGQMLLAAVERQKAAGVTDPHIARDNAVNEVLLYAQRARASAGAAQPDTGDAGASVQATGTAQDQANAQFLRDKNTAKRVVNRGGSAAAAAATGTSQNPGLTLYEKMMAKVEG